MRGLRSESCSQDRTRQKENHYYYVCSTHKHGDGCKSHSISEVALYEAVFQTLTLHIRECARIGEVLAFVGNMPLHQMEARRLQHQIDSVQNNIKKLRQRQVKLYEDFSDGLINREEYLEFKDIFTGQTEAAEKTLDKLCKELDSTVNSPTEKSVWRSISRSITACRNSQGMSLWNCLKKSRFMKAGALRFYRAIRPILRTPCVILKTCPQTRLPRKGGRCKWHGKADE